MTEGKTRATRAPWLTGIVDTLVGARVLRSSSIPHRNRLAVILVDSAFETACRAFLKYKAKVKLNDAHRQRGNLLATIKSKLTEIDEEVWQAIDFYYEEIRCDFYHESAGKTITDEQFFEYLETVEFVIDKAFDTKIADAVGARIASIGESSEAPIPADPAADTASRVTTALHSTSDKLDRILLAVSAVRPCNVLDLNEFFKKQGVSLRLTQEELTSILARNKGSTNLFYYDKELRRWVLSGLGKFRLGRLVEEKDNGS